MVDMSERGTHAGVGGEGRRRTTQGAARERGAGAARERLSKYRARRDFARTPEPPPRTAGAAPHATAGRAGAPSFVVQRHDARRLHFDVRLQIGGAMMSFAVPKGPSYDPAIKRLAVETEDHPLAYNSFEGRIPKGEYGAGEVIVWDRGTYQTVPPGQEEPMRRKGHLHVRLEGEKLQGDWHFVRMARPARTAREEGPARGEPAKAQWLMFKGSEGAAPGFDVTAARPGSVLARRAAPLRNPDKVLFPRDGVTKRDVAEYYAAVAEHLLPHLIGRPLAVERWPDGIEGESWFQQHAPAKPPDFVRVVSATGRRLLVVDDREALAWLANLAALTLHGWASHVPFGAREGAEVEAALDRPDWVVFDLDPGDGPFRDLITIARALRKALDALALDCVLKTSGKRGLHVLVPLARVHHHDEVKRFAGTVARAIAAHLPAIATAERSARARGGRVYVDWLQNGRGKTLAVPYTLRAVDGAPVSTPIAWSELTERLDPRALGMKAALRRLDRKGDLLAEALKGRARLPRTLEARAG